MELAGFEPATSSLRKMRSKSCDQGKRHGLTLLWRGCGTSHVRQREIWHDSLVQSPPPPSGRPLTPQWKHAFAVFSGSLHNPGGAIHGDDLPVPK